MAITFVKVKVSNPARPKRAKTHEFLVDSGAFYSVMPEKDLKAVGIKPTSFEDFLLANGETVRKPLGNALFEFRANPTALREIERNITLMEAVLRFLSVQQAENAPPATLRQSRGPEPEGAESEEGPVEFEATEGEGA